MDVLNSMTPQDATTCTHIGTGGPVSAPPQVVILADDLTGACDSAASFLGSERSAWVWLRDRTVSANAANVWSFSTESRNQTPVVAGERVKKLIEGLAGLPPSTLFFKKVDSAGRGCFAEEMAAASTSMGADLVVYSPSFPEMGRLVLNGYLHVHDGTGERRKTPIHDLVPQHMHPSIGLIQRGTDMLVEQSLRREAGAGKHLLVCDASESEDLERLVRVASRLPQRLLWAGSAGLGRELARVLSSSTSMLRGTRVPVRGRTLIITGSSHPVTQLQLDRLTTVMSKSSLPCVTIQVRYGESSDDNLRKAFREAGTVGSLVLTGGDTAATVLRALGAEAIEIAGEVTVGVPWGILHGGLANGCVVVTKSGGFGSENALVDAVDFCHGVVS
jgi:D-threonate/D-erythronate kinase